MAYSEDYKRRVLEYTSEGHTQLEVSAVFKVNPSTIREWRTRMEEGSLKPKYPKTRKLRKLPPDELSCFVAEHPDAFLEEIGERFGCSAEAVRKALNKLKITRKKRLYIAKNETEPPVMNTKVK